MSPTEPLVELLGCENGHEWEATWSEATWDEPGEWVPDECPRCGEPGEVIA